jgi:hypothetical protein
MLKPRGLDTDPKFTKNLDPEQLVPDPQKETGRDMTEGKAKKAGNVTKKRKMECKRLECWKSRKIKAGWVDEE